jgi:hypothetical protein
MKNNLLTEIKHIKHLMGLIKEDSNDDCEDQLEKSGYVVYTPNEQKGKVESCDGKTKIKCVKKWMEDNGVDSNKYKTDIYKNLCYLYYKSDDMIKLGTQETPDKNWMFWENGDITFIDTFSEAQIPDTAKPEKKYGQYQFKGMFECDGTEIKITNMSYLGSYIVDKYGELIKGVKYTIKGTDKTVETIVSTNFTLDKTTNL